MNALLTGRRAIVTGGGKQIGRAITLALAAAGADVGIVVRRDLEAASAVVREAKALGRTAWAHQADICCETEARVAIATLAEQLGGVDILVNNAGFSRPGPLESLSTADWDDVMAINVRGVFLCSRAALPYMKAVAHGAIVNVAAATAHSSFPFRGAFGPSKAAVLSLTRQMAQEWAPLGIRVNAVSPGAVATETNLATLEIPEIRERIARLPLREMACPADIANAVLFLASQQARQVTGHSLVVDGGSLLTSYLYP